MAALLVDGQDTVKGGGRDIEPLGNSNIILHILVHLAAADHKHMGAAQHIPAHINPVLVFLRDSVVDEQRQIENGADRRKARFVCHPAVAGRKLHIRVGVTAPCGGDVCQRSFQGFVPPFLHILIRLRRISPTPPPLPVGRGTAQRNIYPRRLPPESIAGRNPSRVPLAPPAAAVALD